MNELFNLFDFNKSGQISQDEVVCLVCHRRRDPVLFCWESLFRSDLHLYVQTILFMSGCYSFLTFVGQIPDDPSKLAVFEGRCEALAIEGCASVSPHCASDFCFNVVVLAGLYATTMNMQTGRSDGYITRQEFLDFLSDKVVTIPTFPDILEHTTRANIQLMLMRFNTTHTASFRGQRRHDV